MKAIIINQPGGIEVLQLENIAEPETREGHVKIRIRAFGLNKAETYYRAGNYGEINEPRIPGIEAVGEVIEDKSGAFQVGQKVITAMGGMMLEKHGSYAEYVVAPAANVLAVNTSLSWEELAAIPEAYLTIWGALDKNLNIQTGQTLLVRGGTSSVGLAAIVYAKAKGLKVIATTRNKENAERLYIIGADDVVIDDECISEKVRSIYPQGVDCALEIIGAPTVTDTLQTVKHWGQVCVIGLLGGAPVLDHFGLMSDLPATVKLSFFSSGLLGSTELPINESPIQWIIEKIESKEMPSLLSKTFEFDQIREAHKLMDSNTSLGKIVVKL
ncbi:NADPH:quinone reductase and related Zn-dependent oxidoreductases [hydrothermal vent metagenome]|uniref:NADPH:quinone reductase and related Zn-dependent oxidoreductases n=1 Tax=hydrothermal vent metagenome TaxID=652676 RepID=A0A3B0XJT5_9ZZZZ